MNVIVMALFLTARRSCFCLLKPTHEAKSNNARATKHLSAGITLGTAAAVKSLLTVILTYTYMYH